MAQTSKLRFHKRADWKSGKAKGKHLTSGMKYYTWRGRDKDQGRAWETGDGRTLTYWQARDEILDAKNRAGYTYTFVCGTKTEELDADEYREVLRGRFDRVYFVRHHDQGEGEDRHPHAPRTRPHEGARRLLSNKECDVLEQPEPLALRCRFHERILNRSGNCGREYPRVAERAHQKHV